MNLTAACPLTTDDALRRAAAVGPGVEAVVTPAERITYGELADDVATVRSALAAAGVGRGDHVGICLGNEPRWVSLFLAITSLGGVVVPVNTRFRADELAFVVRQSKMSMLFVADRVLNVDFAEMLREVCPAVDRGLPDEGLPELRRVVVIGSDVPVAASSWADFLARAGPAAQPRCRHDDPALIQYTSGTTAYPKGARLAHRSICADAFFSGSRMGLRIADRFHSARPFFHAAGSTLSILSCLQHTATLVTMPRFEAAEALRLLEAERCTHFSGNDTIALMLLNHPDRGTRRLALRGAWVAASPTITERVIDELGATECVVGYGLSEASPNVAQSCWWDDRALRVSGAMAVQPGVEVRIRDLATGGDPPPGEPGEILVRGWNVMLGYWDMPEQTKQAVDPDGWLSTGDLGALDTDGRLTFVGRAKELIRVGGENVSPAEVEDVLHRHPDIRHAVVVGVPEPRLMEVPVAFVVLGGGRTATPADLVEWARERMAGFKVPRRLWIIDGFEELGMTASSKVQRGQVAAYARKLVDSAQR